MDDYSESWKELWFIMIMGVAGILEKKEQIVLLKEIHRMLIAKYPQYESLGIGESSIKIKPKSCHGRTLNPVLSICEFA